MLLSINLKLSGKNSSLKSFINKRTTPKAMNGGVGSGAIYTVIGNVVSKIRAITPHASVNVGILKKIHAKLTIVKVTIIFTILPGKR